MAEIIASFADGKLLVREERAVQTNYITSGATVRIGHLKTIEKVLSLEAWLSGYKNATVTTNISECLVSNDTLLVLMRRFDFPYILSGLMSNGGAFGVLSAYTSGLEHNAELASGLGISGKMQVAAMVIGY